MPKRPFQALFGEGGTTASTSSMDSNSTQSYRLDVFISFRGPDTRNTFVDHLYAHLISKGIFAFKDDTQLQKGESISPQLLQAIQHSRVSIIVFSKHYAASTWCLDEMAAIAECHLELKQIVFPVFYDVDPSHVRKHNGVYKNAFDLHTRQFEHDPGKVDGWKRAMTCLAGSAGWDVRNKKAFKSGYSSNTCAKLIPEDNQPDEIMKVLQTSFDGLKPGEREIFLHVACFFEGEREDYVRQVLEACGLHPDIRIPCLAEKSLIMIRNEEIHMHEVLQELGKEIVRREHPDEPRLWSRLWLYGDFHRMMMTEMRGREVKAVVLDQKEDDFKFSKLRAEDLSKMKHLKLLILYHRNFSGRPVFLSDALCYLSWNGYPFTSLPLNFQPYDLVELNLPNSSIEQLCKGIQLPSLKRMDLSNSKNLKMTPSFEGIQNLERLDLTGCISLSQVHPSIGLLTGLVFLSLQNCRSLVRLDFGDESRLISLRVLRLSGCTKFESSPDFIGALNLEYLDMDGCTSLSTIHESVGALKMLRFLSLRDCTNLLVMPVSFNSMTSLVTLDLCGCSKLKNLPLRWINSNYSSPLQSLIFLDVSFCNISEVPESIGELRGLERLNLQGNNFSVLPSTIKWLSRLAYLNVSHCHSLEHLPELPIESAPSESVGRYFKTTSGSRDHRSGLYAFDCPCIMKVSHMTHYEWLRKLVKEPRHFRCGFDIVLPLDWKTYSIPSEFDHQFMGGSIIRIKHSNMHVDWIGFLFCAAFEVNNPPTVSGSPHHSPSSPLPHPFYLSFETEHAEERFDLPLSLERNKVDGSNYLWIIYVSREHCHFVKTGAQITFKARQGLIVKEWGLRVLTKQDVENYNWISFEKTRVPLVEVIDNGEESSGSIGFLTIGSFQMKTKMRMMMPKGKKLISII